MLLGFKKEISGMPTGFRDAILMSMGLPPVDGGKVNSLKHHTIRLGNRWKAGDTIHFSFGIRTKAYEQWHVSKCTHVTPIYIKQIKRGVGLFDVVMLHRDEKESIEEPLPTLELCRNDGLTIVQFNDWFRTPPTNERGVQEAQIVHWTDLRYPRISDI